MKKHLIRKLLVGVITLPLALAGLSTPANGTDKNVSIYVTKSDNIESMSFTAFDPNNSSNEKQLNVYPGRDTIPAGWHLKGEVVTKPGKYFYATGTSDLPASAFTNNTATGSGKAASVTFRIEDFTPKNDISVYSWQWSDFDRVRFNLNGGTWTDTLPLSDPLFDGSNTNGKVYNMFITPGSTVYEPKAPTRKGYRFLGWSGKSALNPETNLKGNNEYVTFDRTAPYTFKEVDNIPLNTKTHKWRRGYLVELTAEWAKAPEVKASTRTITVGDDFDPKSMVDSATDYLGKDLKGKVEIIKGADYPKDVAGTYPITFSVTDEWGVKSDDVTVNLVVNPKLELEDKAIEYGGDFDTLVTSFAGGEVKLDPNSKYDVNTPGTYDLTYTVTSPDGTTSVTKTARLTVKHPPAKLAVKDVVIYEGDAFTLADLINPEGTDSKPVADLKASFNTAVAGEYPINFTVTNADGVETTETAKLIVKKRLTPLTPAPVLEVKDLEIWEGDPVDLSSMVTKAEGGKALANPDSKFDANKAGTYPIEFTVTSENGAKTTKSANLIVKKRLTPLTPAPVLEVKDLEIWEGDPVDLSSMVTKAEGGKALANPDSKFDANKAGEYTIEFTVTGENGATTTKTATLIVKPRPESEKLECVCPDPTNTSSGSNSPAGPKGTVKKQQEANKPKLAHTGAQGVLGAGITALITLGTGIVILRRKKI